jgi:hypothetical protein
VVVWLAEKELLKRAEKSESAVCRHLGTGLGE